MKDFCRLRRFSFLLSYVFCVFVCKFEAIFTILFHSETLKFLPQNAFQNGRGAQKSEPPFFLPKNGGTKPQGFTLRFCANGYSKGWPALLTPTVFVGHLTTGGIPVFFNSVFQHFRFFSVFLSQNCEDPVKCICLWYFHVVIWTPENAWQIHARKGQKRPFNGLQH